MKTCNIKNVFYHKGGSNSLFELNGGQTKLSPSIKTFPNSYSKSNTLTSKITHSNNPNKRNVSVSLSKKTKRDALINSMNYYKKYFVNTKFIPTSNVLKYIYNNYAKYKQDKTMREFALYLADCFQFNKPFQEGKREYNLNTFALGNPTFSLYKLISYSFYIKMPYCLEKEDGGKRPYEEFIEIVKYQMGKDIVRDNRTINKQLITITPVDEDDRNQLSTSVTDLKYKYADQLYLKLMQTYSMHYNGTIDYDKINIAMLLSCQNMFGLLTDLITMKVNDILQPEINSVFRPSKQMHISIDKEKMQIQLLFTSKLIISNNGGQFIDPEYPCGKLKFAFAITLSKQDAKYFIPKFEFRYNLNECSANGDTGLPKNTVDLHKISDKEGMSSLKNINMQYALPVATGVGGLLATPFLLAFL
jgi:hypothetical protein